MQVKKLITENFQFHRNPLELTNFDLLKENYTNKSST